MAGRRAKGQEADGMLTVPCEWFPAEQGAPVGPVAAGRGGLTGDGDAPIRRRRASAHAVQPVDGSGVASEMAPGRPWWRAPRRPAGSHVSSVFRYHSVSCVGTAMSDGSAALPRRACTTSSDLARTSPYASALHRPSAISAAPATMAAVPQARRGVMRSRNSRAPASGARAGAICRTAKAGATGAKR